MITRLFTRWKQYKYRFVPWMVANINESSPRLVAEESEDKIITDADVETSFKSILQSFHYDTSLQVEQLHQANNKVLLESAGFQIGRLPSSLKNGGTGVFVTEGHVAQGKIVAMYPGLVYQPWEPVFLVSLANPFLFRCADGIHIDGKDTGLSKMMYNSCAKRDRVLGEYMCDTSWLQKFPINPLGIGQYVNNQSPEYPANVAYQEFDIPENFPTQLLKFLPNTKAQMQQDLDISAMNRLLRVVLLVSVREIQKGEELFSTYYTIVKKDKT